MCAALFLVCFGIMRWLDQLCKSVSSAHSKGPAALTYLCIILCMILQRYTMKTALVAWRRMSSRRSVAVLRHSHGHFVLGVNVWFLLQSEESLCMNCCWLWRALFMECADYWM